MNQACETWIINKKFGATVSSAWAKIYVVNKLLSQMFVDLQEFMFFAWIWVKEKTKTVKSNILIGIDLRR